MQGAWIADPFVVRHDGRTLCFVEEFVAALGHGRIAVYDVTEGEGVRLGVSLEEPFHLSFPYVFEHEGSLFMCPEAASSGQLRLYRCLGDPCSWELDTVLVDGIRAVDPLIVEAKAGWVLLANVDEADVDDFSTGLWKFTSPTLRSAEWTSSPSNPVVDDERAMRNAGLLRHSSRVFRVGQFSAFNEYGTDIEIREITALSTDSYSERVIASLKPHFWRRVKGIHHMSATEGLTVFDAYFD